MTPILAIRCRFYNENGDPIGNGCSLKEKGCSFIHPNDPAWRTAMPFVRSSSSVSNTSATRGTTLLTPPKFKFRRRPKSNASDTSILKKSSSLSLQWKNAQDSGVNNSKEKNYCIAEDGSGWSSLQLVAQSEIPDTCSSTGAETTLANSRYTRHTSNYNDGSEWTPISQPESNNLNTWGVNVLNKNHSNLSKTNNKDTFDSTVHTSEGDNTSDWIFGGWGSSSGSNAAWVDSSSTSSGWGNTNSLDNSNSQLLGGWGASTENTDTGTWGANTTGIVCDADNGTSTTSTVTVTTQDIEMVKEIGNDANVSNSFNALEQTPVVATEQVANETIDPSVVENDMHNSFGLSKWDSNWHEDETHSEILAMRMESLQKKDFEKNDSPDPSETDSDPLADSTEHNLTKLSEKYRLGSSLRTTSCLTIIQTIMRGTGNYYNGSLANADYRNYKSMQQSSGYSSVTDIARGTLAEGRSERRRKLYKHLRKAETFAKGLTNLEQTLYKYKPAPPSESDLPVPDLFLHDTISYLQNAQRWIMDAHNFYNPNTIEDSLRESDSLEEGEIDEKSPVINQLQQDEPAIKKSGRPLDNIFEYFETVKTKLNRLDAVCDSRLLELSPKTVSRLEDLYLRGVNDHFQHKSTFENRFDEKFELSSAIKESKEAALDQITNFKALKESFQADVAEWRNDVDEPAIQPNTYVELEQKEEFQQMLDILKAENKRLRESLLGGSKQPTSPSQEVQTKSDFYAAVAKHLYAPVSAVEKDVICEVKKLKDNLHATVNTQTEEVLGAVYVPLQQTLQLFQSISQKPKLIPPNNILSRSRHSLKQ